MRRMLERRVVVTGVGLVTPLGVGVEKNWDALMTGRSGIGPITRFDASEFPARIAGEVRDFSPEDWIEKRDVKKMDPFIQYAVASADDFQLCAGPAKSLPLQTQECAQQPENTLDLGRRAAPVVR